MLYIYLDKDDYLIGYGGEPAGDRCVEVESVPEEVTFHMECYRYVDGEFVLDEDRLRAVQAAITAERELRPVIAWFDWYDEQCIQYQRCQRLGVKFDKDIAELDAQANENAARVKELRKIMANPFDSKG